jgi:cardiolipin synthase
MTRQLAADSVVAVAEHPLRCGRNTVIETAEHVTAWSLGAVGKRIYPCCYGPPAPLGPCDAPPSDGPPDERYCQAHFELYPEPCAALEALHHAIDQATDRIDILMFIWESDDVGTAVADWLTARAAAGVHVRVLIDGGGNLMFSHPTHGVDVNAAVCALARQPNVEVVRGRDGFFCFDHRKLVLIDGCLAWTGGRNLTHKSFFGQHDLSFVASGPIVDRLQHCFNDAWVEQGGCVTRRAGAETLTGNGERGTGNEIPSAFPVPRSPFPVSEPPNAWVRLVESASCAHNLAPELYQAVEHAHHHIYLENGYLSDGRLLCKLAAARRRGVDVRVVITLASKESVVDCANRVTANRLLAAGVRVFICPCMTHMKAGAIDGCWAYLGSGNYDALSLRHNCELGMLIGGGPLLGEIEEQLFCADCRPDWELKKPLHVTIADYLGEMVMCLCL